MQEPLGRSDPDPLRAFLWGKRRSRRHPLVLDVELRAPLGTIPAMSVDVSAGGALLRVPTSRLAPEAAADGEVDPLLLVQTHFRQACRARFRQRRVDVHLEVVRLDLRPTEPDFLYLGCRFSRPLDEEQLRRFALRPADCASELHALPSDMTPLRLRGAAWIALVYGEDEADRPAIAGRILGIGDATLCLGVDDAAAASAAVALRTQALRMEVTKGGGVVWRSGARLKAIGFLDDPRAGLELGFVVDQPFGPLLDGRVSRVEALPE
jgi:hypothetical protein